MQLEGTLQVTFADSPSTVETDLSYEVLWEALTLVDRNSISAVTSSPFCQVVVSVVVVPDSDEIDSVKVGSACVATSLHSPRKLL